MTVSLALLLCAGTFSAVAGETAFPLISLKERSAAPELKLQDIDGKTRRLSDLRGKVVLVNFWATWCPPCRREMPSMQRLYQSLPRERFEILAVNVGEDDNTVFAFTGTLEPSPAFGLLFDRDSLTMRKWAVRGLPTSFVIDKDGRVALRAVGGRDFDSPNAVEQIQTLLDESR
ncbi:MAG: TlpA disulfide reductase family protein [Sulfuricella sp.]|nr:TlpA disulfide reductase family protein [Sulfuricella sp.]